MASVRVGQFLESANYWPGSVPFICKATHPEPSPTTSCQAHTLQRPSTCPITPGHVPDNQEQRLRSRTRQNDANQPIQSHVTLPCPFLPMKPHSRLCPPSPLTPSASCWTLVLPVWPCVVCGLCPLLLGIVTANLIYLFIYFCHTKRLAGS